MQPCGASIFSSEEGPTYEYKKDKNGNYVKVGNKIDYLLDKDGNVIDFTEVKYSSGGYNRTYGERTMLESPALIDPTPDILSFFVPIRLAVLKAVAYLSRAVRVGRVVGVALNSASESYKGTTCLGHALSKHAGRNPQTWGKIRGNPSTWHSQGLKHFNDIMNAPGKFNQVTNPNGIKFLQKSLPDGRGMRLNLNGTFKGFID